MNNITSNKDTFKMIEFFTHAVLSSLKATVAALWKGIVGVLTGLGLIQYGEVLLFQISPGIAQEWVVAIMAIVSAFFGAAYTGYKLFDFIRRRRQERKQDQHKHEIEVVKELVKDNLITEEKGKEIVASIMEKVYG